MNWSSLSLFATKTSPVCKGKISHADRKQASFEHLPLNRIVVLSHGDLEEEQALELIARKVKGVLHCGRAMSGQHPTLGPLLLLQQHIPIWEMDAYLPSLTKDEADVSIYTSHIVVLGQTLACQAFTREDWLMAQQAATEHAEQGWEPFVEHTLAFAMRAKQAAMTPLPTIALRTQLQGRHVIVVSDGRGHRNDLQTARDFIRACEPILIGVGEGADTLLTSGYIPDIVVYDADQVISERVAGCRAEIVRHTNPEEYEVRDQLARASIKSYHSLACFGNREDAALLLAYEHGAEWLLTVGVKSSMSDFLAKGHADMGSALLVRMKIGARLVDIKSLAAFPTQPERGARELISTIVLSGVFIGLSWFQLQWIVRRASHVVYNLVGNQ